MLVRCLTLAQSDEGIGSSPILVILLVAAFVIALVAGGAFLRMLATLAEIASIVARALFAGLGTLVGVGTVTVLLVVLLSSR